MASCGRFSHVAQRLRSRCNFVLATNQCFQRADCDHVSCGCSHVFLWTEPLFSSSSRCQCRVVDFILILSRGWRLNSLIKLKGTFFCKCFTPCFQRHAARPSV